MPLSSVMSLTKQQNLMLTYEHPPYELVLQSKPYHLLLARHQFPMQDNLLETIPRLLPKVLQDSVEIQGWLLYFLSILNLLQFLFFPLYHPLSEHEKIHEL